MACLVAQSLVLARGKDSRMASDCVKCKANKTSASDPKRGKSISSSFGALISIHFDNEIKTSNIQIVHSVQVRSIFDSFSATTYNTIFHAAALEWTLDFSLFLIFFFFGKDFSNSSGTVLLFALVHWVAAEISLSSSCCQCMDDKGNGLNGSQSDPEKYAKLQRKAESPEIYCIPREAELQLCRVARWRCHTEGIKWDRVLLKNFSSECF